MPGLPEAIMAREAGMEYAALTVVTNPGAGLGGSVDHEANSAFPGNNTAEAVSYWLKSPRTF